MASIAFSMVCVVKRGLIGPAGGRGGDFQRPILHHRRRISHGPLREAQKIDVAAILLLARGSLRLPGNERSAERAGRRGWGRPGLRRLCTQRRGSR